MVAAALRRRAGNDGLSVMVVDDIPQIITMTSASYNSNSGGCQKDAPPFDAVLMDL